jgi:hypothetical protein
MRYAGPADSRLAVALSRGPPRYPAPRTRAMTIQLINPADLPAQATGTQAVVAAGTTLVVIAGQEPEDVHRNPVAPGRPSGPGPPGRRASGPRAHRGRRPPGPGRHAHHRRGGLPIRIPAGHRATQGGAIRAPQARRPAHRRAAAGPARVPHRCRRDRGEMKIRQLREVGAPAECQGRIEPRPPPLAWHGPAARPVDEVIAAAGPACTPRDRRPPGIRSRS